ncbi:N-acetylneuraminate synthase [Alsobacter metallidurans]|uniref:N-acetylneuraminate synthase n=1 Tax=Alsobacter metallidurans TaxID=340221 RepID=A0A917I535_9HYPH|nr:N-acetylneuraminate synthase family protein [Alsobacter metallidurans]GGH15502.1 N-acetylneuraminate synthase [Alsobacter metallidurans]
MTTRWPVGQGKRLIIGEVGLAHEGSLGSAQSFIDLIADAGCDAVKFQTHIAEAESTPEEKFRVPLSGQDGTRYDYWTRTAFTEAQWRSLVERTHAKGIAFISSPFSEEAVDLLARVGADALKIASGEVSNLPLLERAAATGLPVILSSGMSPQAELDRAVNVLKSGGAAVSILQCTSAYPCPPEKLGLNVLAEMRERYGVPVGLSDHSGDIFAGLAAVTLGADVLEVHVCFSKDMYGPDVKASLTREQLHDLVRGVAFIDRALSNPVNKDDQAQALDPLRKLFTKSVVAGRELPAGAVLDRAALAFKKPGIGIPVSDYERLLGKRLARPVPKDHFFADGDFDH